LPRSSTGDYVSPLNGKELLRVLHDCGEEILEGEGGMSFFLLALMRFVRGI
jgi:hypothetical protein